MAKKLNYFKLSNNGNGNAIWLKISARLVHHQQEYHPLAYGLVTKGNINLFEIKDHEIKRMLKKLFE